MGSAPIRARNGRGITHVARCSVLGLTLIEPTWCLTTELNYCAAVPSFSNGLALSSVALSTPAFWCRVVRSRDVHPCYGLTLSVLALSTPAIWCRIVRSCDVQFRDFSFPLFMASGHVTWPASAKALGLVSSSFGIVLIVSLVDSDRVRDSNVRRCHLDTVWSCSNLLLWRFDVIYVHLFLIRARLEPYVEADKPPVRESRISCSRGCLRESSGRNSTGPEPGVHDRCRDHIGWNTSKIISPPHGTHRIVIRL